MNKQFVKKNFLDYHKDFDEYTRHCVNREPRGMSRFELLKFGRHRVGKLYWDKITIVYGREQKKPFLRIKTLNGLKLTIFQDSFTVQPKEQMDDKCYIRRLPPNFVRIEFYGDFEWNVNLKELRKDN